ILSEHPLVGNVTLRGVDGAIVASGISPPSPPPAILGELAEVLRTGRPSVSQLVFGAIRGKRTVLLGYPVVGDSGKPMGVLAFSLELPQLETLLATLPLPEGSVVVRADKNNLVMSRSVASEEYIGSVLDVPRTGPPTSFQLDADGVARLHANAMIHRRPGL